MIAPWVITLGCPCDHSDVSDVGRPSHLHEKVPARSAVDTPGVELTVLEAKERGR